MKNNTSRFFLILGSIIFLASMAHSLFIINSEIIAVNQRFIDSGKLKAYEIIRKLRFVLHTDDQTLLERTIKQYSPDHKIGYISLFDPAGKTVIAESESGAPPVPLSADERKKAKRQEFYIRKVIDENSGKIYFDLLTPIFADISSDTPHPPPVHLKQAPRRILGYLKLGLPVRSLAETLKQRFLSVILVSLFPLMLGTSLLFFFVKKIIFAPPPPDDRLTENDASVEESAEQTEHPCENDAAGSPETADKVNTDKAQPSSADTQKHDEQLETDEKRAEEIKKRRDAEKALIESEQRYRDLFENAVIGLYKTTPDGKILMANPALIRMLGFSSFDELRKRNLEKNSSYVDAEARMKFKKKLEKEGAVSGFESGWYRKDGSILYVRENARAIRDKNENTVYYEGTVEDITETKKAEKVIKQYTLRLETQRIIDKAILAADSPKDIAVATLENIGSLLPSDRSSVALFDFENKIVRIIAANNIGVTRLDSENAMPLDDFGKIEELRWRRYSIVKDIRKLKNKSRTDLVLLEEGVRSYMMVALFSRNELIGSLNLGSSKCGAFDTEHVEAASSLAHQMAMGIQQNRLQSLLKISEERYALAARGVNDGLWDWNIETGEVYYSPRWKEMLGYDEHDIGNTLDDWFDLIHADDREKVSSRVKSHIRGVASNFSSEYRMKHADGAFRWVLCRGQAVRDDNGKALRMAGSQTDITDRKRYEQQLLHDAFHDGLTGLPNRDLFLNRLNNAILRKVNKNNKKIGILYLDLDRFKNVNDTLGHQMGDKLLIEVGKRLKKCLRDADILSRFAGDEFAVLMENVADKYDAVKVADRIIESITEPFQIKDQTIYIGVSIGIIIDDAPDSSPEKILRNADIAMYQAKNKGSCYSIFHPGMHDVILNRLNLEKDLREAIESNQFTVYYQPIISLQDNKIVGFEALARWMHPQKGIIMPSRFIPFSEENELIIPVGKLILDQAFSTMDKWRKKYDAADSLFLSVNLSNKQFSDPQFEETIHAFINKYSIPPHKIRIEITESVIMDDPAAALKILQKLKKLDVQIHLDDFGSGYSSLGNILEFPLDGLKIDQAFTARITQNYKNWEIVKMIVSLAQSLNLSLVVEGIESKEQVDLLKSLNCKFGQGIFFYPAQSLEKVEHLLENFL